MARGVNFVGNNEDLKKILKSDDVQDALRDVGQRVITNTGRPDDYEMDETIGADRARVAVHTNEGDWAAHGREARDHRLISAIASMGGGP